MLGIFTWPLIFVVGVAIMYGLVPKREISRFWGMGLVAGLGMALVLTYLMGNVLGYWRFIGGDIVLAGIPLFLAAVWMPLIILYSYWVSKSDDVFQLALAIGTLALLAATAHWYYLRQGMLVYAEWNVLYTFILAVIIHCSLLYYLFATKQLGDRIPDKGHQ